MRMAKCIFVIFSVLLAHSINANQVGACYLKIWKIVVLAPGLTQVHEEMTCEPLTLKKCHDKEKEVVARGIAKAALMQSWVEGEACKHL